MTLPTQSATPSPSRAEDLALLKSAVREAGKIAHGYFGRSPVARRKADGTQVSEADIAVDNALKVALMGARPSYGWLSEETVDDRSRLDKRRVWIVDPIDGTRAFLDERPDWTVAAALVEDGRPVLGIVYNPVRDEFFEAVEGGGARLNGTRIAVTQPSVVDGASLIVSGGLLRRRDWSMPWPPVQTQWVNSVAYRLSLIAAGRHDATISLSRKSDWDLAAAHVLVQEAGGRITSHAGTGFVYNASVPVQPSVVAAGPALHALLIQRTAPLKLK